MQDIKVIILCFVSILNNVHGISLINGKYQNINIVIQNTVEENEILIERIKEIFTNSSRFLFEATRRQVYFGNINIIIPNTWSSKPAQYEEIPTLSEINSYITIEGGKVKAPHTKRKRKKCGSPGRYIYLPASFLLEEGKTMYGNHDSLGQFEVHQRLQLTENVVVHEWGHLRWGLWDEYGIKKNGRFYLEDGVWKHVGCSTSVRGKVGRGSQCTRDTSKCDMSNTETLINETCKFCPDEAQTLSNMSSIMSFNWVDAVSTFCDNENDTTVPVHQRHNSRGQSKQNVKCKGQSSWEVMREHEDFTSATTLPESTNTAPTFRILQETVGYRVFVLDKSGSMGSNARIFKLYQASAYIIQTKIPENSWLGIVWFNSTAYPMKELTKVFSQQVRDELVSALPQAAEGGTCIGCGIDTALAYLKAKLNDTTGSEIIVISDGVDGYPDKLNSSIQNAVNASVTIHSISVSQDADTRMIYIATATGGKHISYLEVGKISIASVFTEILSSAVTSFATESVTLVSEQYTPSSNMVEASFNIDSSVGKGTSVSILQANATYAKVDVFNPNGTVYTKDATEDYIILDIPGTAIAGHYNVTVFTTLSSLELYVTSLPTDSEAVRVFSWISPVDFDYSSGELPVVEADVMKGRAAVLNAVVTAAIETATNSCEVSLLDNGADPDDTSDDGVYAGVIPAFCINTDGRVSAKVYVKGEKGTASVQDVFSGAGSPDSDEEEERSEVLEDDFQRQTVSNEILVKNYVSGDVTAPGRITDVSIVDISTEHTQYDESRNFTITWTATGDDVNIGQAMEYELRISNDNNFLANDFSNAELLSISNTNFTPKASGEAEYIRIEIDAEESYTSTTFFAIRAKDEVGNTGAVSNIISILVANGYRMAVEGNVVYSHSYTGNEATEEAVVEKEKKKNLITLAIGLSSAAAVIVIAIIAVTIGVKKTKAKESVEDSEFGSRTSTTTVFSIEKTLKDFFTVKPTRPTVAKKVFQSSQLESIPEREQHWTASFSLKPMSALSEYKRKPFDIISQGSCSIEMLSEHNYAFDEDICDNDTRSICSGLPREISNSRDDMFTVEDTWEGDFLPGEITNEVNFMHTSRLNNRELQGIGSEEEGINANKNKCEFLATLNSLTVAKSQGDQNESSTGDELCLGATGTGITRDTGKEKPKRFEFKRREECFDERSTSNSDLSYGFPVLDSKTMSKELRKMYENMHL